jgi:hypothetical protein
MGSLTLRITERHIEGLSRTTIQNYCSRGRGDLVRGRDFIIRRYAVGRSRAMITDRGLELLMLRQYRTRSRFRPNPKEDTPTEHKSVYTEHKASGPGGCGL